MLNFIKLYVITLCVFFAIDLLWLGVIAKNMYREAIGHLMAEHIHIVGALLFYVVYVFGLLFFSLLPALKENNSLTAYVKGAIFGFMCYATYDLTNLATLKNWPISIVVYDLLWGTFLSGLTCGLSFWITKKWNSSTT
jgi:uncharacterized membrane protein